MCINTGKSRHSCQERPMVWDLVIDSVYIQTIGIPGGGGLLDLLLETETCRYKDTDTKHLIKISHKSALSDSLDHILNHLDTSLSNDLGVSRSSSHDSNCCGEAPLVWLLKMVLDSAKHSLASSCLQRNGSATIKERHTNKRNSNWSLVIKKGCASRYIRPITLNPWDTCHFLFSTYIWSQLVCFVVPSLEFYINVIPQTLNILFDIVNYCFCLKDVNIFAL